MIDISSKVSSFRKLVWEVEKRKSEKQIYDSINTSSDIIDRKRKELDENLKLYLEKRKIFAISRKNEIVASKSEEEKSNFNIYKKELLEEIINDIQTQLINYTKTSDYKDKLKTEVKKIFEKLQKSSRKKYILSVKKDDLSLFKEYKTQQLNEDYIGGFIIEDLDKTFQYDYSLKRKLENEKYEIGKSLYALLEGGDIKNDSHN